MWTRSCARRDGYFDRSDGSSAIGVFEALSKHGFVGAEQWLDHDCWRRAFKGATTAIAVTPLGTYRLSTASAVTLASSQVPVVMPPSFGAIAILCIRACKRCDE